MRITLAQTNSIIGNFEANTSLIKNTIEKHTETDLFLFPELAISGYMPYDYIAYKNICNNQDKYLHSITQSLANSQVAIVGGMKVHEKSNIHTENTYENCAFILCANGIQAIHTKCILPADDVFFETRYFLSPHACTHGTTHTIHDMKIGIFICYDLWHKEYVMNTAKANLDCIVWISASPYTKYKHAQRLFLAHQATRLTNAPLFMTNAVGANDEIVFDGQSFLMNKDGDLVYTCALCTEDTQSFEINNARDVSHVSAEKTIKPQNIRTYTVPQHSPYTTQTRLSKLSLEKAREILSVLELGLTDYLQKNCMPMHVHVGLSGGIDSAVTAAIAVRALGHHAVTALLLPSQYTNEQNIRDAQILAKNLNIQTHTLEITPIFQSTLNQFSTIHTQNKCGITEENMQARIRGMLLMAYANECSSMLLTTGNKSEVAVGYCTLYGDMCGALNLIGDLYKTEVYKIAEAINTDANKSIISQSIMNKEPTAELRENQKDSDSLPQYSLLDAMLYEFIENKYNPASVCNDVRFADKKNLVEEIWHLLKKAEYKRYQAAPIIKVSECAFGRGRIMPIATQI